MGSRSVKIVDWEEERGVFVNNNVFPPGRRYPQSDCSWERSGRVIGRLSRPTQRPQVGGWRVAGGSGSSHQQASDRESKREGFWNPARRSLGGLEVLRSSREGTWEEMCWKGDSMPLRGIFFKNSFLGN